MVDPETLNLIEIFLTFNFFTFKRTCYKQIIGTTMGSSLSLVDANIFMEQFFEEMALNIFQLKTKCWFHFVDETFVFFPHDHPSLTSLFNHINNISPRIQFIMEIQ
jgi:hypothetical protein